MNNLQRKGQEEGWESGWMVEKAQRGGVEEETQSRIARQKRRLAGDAYA